MTTDNEKLCMAIINNSAVTSIDWPGVGKALGLKVNSAQKRWKRFKDVSIVEKSTNGRPGQATEDVKTNKKRGIAEVDDGGEEAVRRLPARKARGKRVKIETLSSNEESAEGVQKDFGEDKELYEEEAGQEV